MKMICMIDISKSSYKTRFQLSSLFVAENTCNELSIASSECTENPLLSWESSRQVLFNSIAPRNNISIKSILTNLIHVVLWLIIPDIYACSKLNINSIICLPSFSIFYMFYITFLFCPAIYYLIYIYIIIDQFIIFLSDYISDYKHYKRSYNKSSFFH